MTAPAVFRFVLLIVFGLIPQTLVATKISVPARLSIVADGRPICQSSRDCLVSFRVRPGSFGGIPKLASNLKFEAQVKAYRYDTLESDPSSFQFKANTLALNQEEDASYSLPFSLEEDSELIILMNFPDADFPPLHFALLHEEGRTYVAKNIPEIFYGMRDKTFRSRLLRERFQHSSQQQNSSQMLREEACFGTAKFKVISMLPCQSVFEYAHEAGGDFKIRPYTALRFEIKDFNGIAGKVLVNGAFVGFGPSVFPEREGIKRVGDKLVFEKFFIEDQFSLQIWNENGNLPEPPAEGRFKMFLLETLASSLLR